MKVPIFKDAIQDNTLSGIIEEVREAKDRKEFAEKPPEREITTDFDREKIEKELKPDPPEPPEQRSEPKEKPPKKPFMPYEEQAEMIVTAFDSIQTIGISALAKKTSFSDEEKKLLKTVKKKWRKNKNSLDEIEQLLMDKWMMIKDFEEELEFDAKEISFLMKPLTRILESAESEMKPSHALLVAAATVTVPRLAMYMGLRSDMADIGNIAEELKLKHTQENGESNQSNSGAKK